MVSSPPAPDAAALRAAFDAPEPLTVGLEEELMLLDPGSHDLAPRAGELLEAAAGDPRFKRELPAAQLEIVTAPAATVPEAIAALAGGRRDLVALAAGRVRPAAAGVHPFAAAHGELSPGERYDATRADYASIAHRQLVFGLQVHVAVGGADATLAVYNALRAHVPEIAALAANAPFYEGRDTGLASVRPTISSQLPRQGVPPPIASWEAFAELLRWGAAAGGVPEPRRWWWELRPHPAYGTLEARVPDAQTTVREAAAVAALVQALVARLAERHAEGESLPVAETWRIAENRWTALRHGLDAELADLVTGERVPVRERLAALVDDLGDVARRLGCAAELELARELAAGPGGAEAQRAVARESGPHGVARWLADRYAPGASSAGAGAG